MFGRAKLKNYDLSADELSKLQYAKFTTARGVIWVKLFPEEAPNTVANFAYLAKNKIPDAGEELEAALTPLNAVPDTANETKIGGFYDGLNFHRVIPGFMAQGGCPDGTGAGGPDWAIACETDKNTSVHKPGTLSMAHAGPNTGGSQFFITFVDTPHLDGVHTVFGAIEEDDEESFKILNQIQGQDAINSIEVLESK